MDLAPLLNAPRSRRSRKASYDPSKQISILYGPAEYPTVVVYTKSFVHLDRVNFDVMQSPVHVPPKHTIVRFDPPMKLKDNEAVKIITCASGLVSIRKIKKPYVKKHK